MSGKPPEVEAREWRALGASVRGAQHIRRGLPNQDAIAWRAAADAGGAATLAVADGHGSARHARSAEGAQMAARLAAEFLMAEGAASSLDPSGISRISAQKWPALIARRWSEAVRAHHAAHPLAETSETEAEALYGTTLLAVLAAPGFLVHLQIGDGEMLAVSETGEVSRPLPPDPRCLGVATVSLCSPNAKSQFRTRFQRLSGPPPALMMAATDGYGTSFASDEAFAQAGTDFWNLLRAEGPGAVQERLPEWLRETSEAGSGDDVTLGLLYRPACFLK